MTKAELLEALEPLSDDCEIVVTNDAFSEYMDIYKLMKEKNYNRAYLLLDVDLFFDGYRLKEIIKYVLENDNYRWDDQERMYLEDLVELWD